MKLEELQEKIKAAGVIGAGGAGFPTHQKLAPGIDTVIINAAECEPLVYTDYTILKLHLKQVLEGGEAFRAALGAKELVIAMKQHTAERLGLENNQNLGENAKISSMPNAYPMGDEIVLIYQTTGRVVPPGQLPSAAGVVVINVETAYNVANSLHDIPVTQKWLTIGGAVLEPVVVQVPINCNVKDLFKELGIRVPNEMSVLDGGPAMGALINYETAIVTKKTKSLLVLPNTISAITNKTASLERTLKRTSSACCQCTLCTDLCPRHLLGYPIAPHKTLRSVGNQNASLSDLQPASLCCGCRVCEMMACCQGLSPVNVMLEVRKSLLSNRIGYKSNEPTKPNPERDFRFVSSDRLMARIGVLPYDKIANYHGKCEIKQDEYVLLLSQHVGKPSRPVVAVNDAVKAGQIIAEAQPGISAALHSPISGVVSSVNDVAIKIKLNLKLNQKEVE